MIRLQSGTINPPEILRPVRVGYIAVTLLAALLLNLVALPAFLQLLRPDFIALTLIYWVVYHPRRVGFLPAWLLGLAMDVADGSLEIDIADNGKGVEAGLPGSGHGLKNLSTRLNKLGGQCTVEPRPSGGTIVKIRLPLPVSRQG